MKNILKYSTFLFGALVASTLFANAQTTTSTPAKQETAQVAPVESFFGVEALDNARNKVEDAYVKYQNAPADKQMDAGAEFRQLRRLYLVELDRQSANYPSTTVIGAKIHSEMMKTYKDLR